MSKNSRRRKVYYIRGAGEMAVLVKVDLHLIPLEFRGIFEEKKAPILTIAWVQVNPFLSVGLVSTTY